MSIDSMPVLEPLSRRQMLRRSAVGFGYLALSALLAEEAAADTPADPLAPKLPHLPARAKRVIFLFMKGGPSHVDTFDYKPLLQRDHGKPLPFAKPRVVSSQTGNLLRSPWSFKRYGGGGAYLSAVFPPPARCVGGFWGGFSLHGSHPPPRRR